MSKDIDNISIGFILVGDETTASTRHRILEPTKYFGDKFEIEFLSFRAHRSDFLGRSLSNIIFSIKMVLFSFNKDIIYVQKIPLPGYLVKTLSLVCGEIVFDFDDALYTSPEWEDDRPSRRSRLKQSIDASSIVITGNPNLSNFARQYNDHVYTIPTSVPKEEQVAVQNSSTQVTIGWIGGPGNLRYLELIKEPLESILEDFDCELKIVTGEEPPVTPLKNHQKVRYATWSLQDEQELIKSFDIMIRPMPDTEWINGKGGYTSVIRCMSLGVPVVASPIEPLSEITSPGKSILFSETPNEWYDALERLICDDDFRKQSGLKARHEVDTQGLWTEDYAREIQEILECLHTQ
ncbi:glycosyltransferase [Halostagnicola kamekurae]|nr:glycosyltransferase [Halostagnicola kamekurae]